MFSGGDSSDGINSLNQFGTYGFVNQIAVSNAMAAGQNIDWAQLAQQWIQMRDNSELEAKTDSDVSANKVEETISNSFKFEEKGEADMDMDDEEQADDKATQRNNDLAPSSVVHNNFNQSWFFGEDNSRIAPQSASNNQWSPWTNRENLPNQNPINNRHINPTAHIPSLLKITVPHPNEMPDIPNQPDNTNVMDAAKRKGLPAWIREGLEKMEREKLKQMEKVQQNKNVNLSDEENTSNKDLLVKPTSFLSGVTATVLDDESTDEEDVVIRANSQSDINLNKHNDEDDKYSSLDDKTYEQKLAELMIVVRRTLTELLLEATNEEISKVADETIKIFKSKASSAQVIRKSALSTLTDKLDQIIGLAAYGDSSSDNDSDNDERSSSKKTSSHSESDNDSEEEIRNVIRLKRRAFIKTSEEIEERIGLAAAREEEKLKYFLRKEEEEKEHNRGKQERPLARDPSTSGHSGHNNFKGYEKDFGEITETKIQHLNGKRQRDRSSRRERITRFSDNKDKYVALPNAATFLTSLSNPTNFASGNNTTAPATNSQRQNIPDINGLLPNYTSTGITTALNAADAALEKALKGKAPINNEKLNRRREGDRNYNQSKKRRLSESKQSQSRSQSSSSSTSSSSSSTSSNSDSSSSRSSHHSKYKHRSSKKHKSHTSVEKQYEKSRKDNRSERKYSSSSYKKRDRESTSSHNHRNVSSDSEDEYRRQYRNESNYTRNSSQPRSYTASTRSRDREHSRSHSRSSYSSNNRRH